MTDLKDSCLTRLEKIYRLLDQALEAYSPACAEGCAACCTCNVTMTCLEADYLVNGLSPEALCRLEERIKEGFPETRYSPEMTTNRFARLCMEGRDIPEEINDPSWGKCPALANGRCSIYEGRPLGCRLMISQTVCMDGGSASIPEMAQSLQNLFVQVVEHLDQDGFTANFSDMLTWYFKHNEDVQASGPDASLSSTGAGRPDGAVKNEKIPVIMVPPEHQKALANIISSLSRLMT